MAALFHGVKVGLVLCFLIGPIFFTLIQTAVEQGFRASAMIGLGVWVSDFIYILAAFLGLQYIGTVADNADWQLIMGIAGAVILGIFGIITLLDRSALANMHQPKPIRSSSYLSLWLKGFLINSLNPFNIIFWLGMMTTIMVNEDLRDGHTWLFFVGVLGTVALTDIGKILAAKSIRRWMLPHHLLWLRRISGLALIIFGVVLLVRVL